MSKLSHQDPNDDHFDLEDIFNTENLTCDNFEYVASIKQGEIEVGAFKKKLLFF